MCAPCRKKEQQLDVAGDFPVVVPIFKRKTTD